MFNIALYQPEIPPNTGNIIRLCANTGCTLSLIGPLGFSLEEKALRRAGLDYHDLASVKVFEDWEAFSRQVVGRLVSFSTKHDRRHSEFTYQKGDTLLFGSESSGLPDPVREQVGLDNRLTIPMLDTSRSLNLSNSVAIVVYEAWRQNGFSVNSG